MKKPKHKRSGDLRSPSSTYAIALPKKQKTEFKNPKFQLGTQQLPLPTSNLILPAGSPLRARRALRLPGLHSLGDGGSISFLSIQHFSFQSDAKLLPLITMEA